MNIAPDARAFLGVNAAVLCAVAAGTSELSLLHSRRTRSLAGQMRKGLSLSGRRLHDGGVVHEVPADELKPGEEIVIDSGQTVPADAVIVAGQASVRPWLGSKLTVTRTEGDTVVAGSKVLSGALRAVVRWAGDDRAWARLTYDPLRRADRHTAPGRLAKRLATTGAVGAGGAVALALISANAQPALVVGYAAAAFGALANVAIPELTALAVWHAMRALLARGVSFRTPDALDRASQISTAVFCSRGTLLSGAPRVASIEPFGTTDTHTLLAWIAGAYRSTPSATGAALQLAAREHQVQADAARSPTYHPGLGITAVASTGQPLVVGARDLLLRQRVSVAAAEGRITELERLGRSVVLVALDGRLVGLVALQDSLTRGARAAVQQLLDAGVEPVWISVDSRQTADALAGRIGIAHVRPEVAFDECALEIQRLQRSGHRVAVIGRGSVDDLALGAGDLSINVGSRGGVLERWDVDILSGDLRDAATAVRVCRQVRAQTFAARLTICGPVIATLALLPLGVPAWSAPLAGLVGAAFAARRLTATATRRTGRKDADR
jgi:cation transport ATPase